MGKRKNLSGFVHFSVKGNFVHISIIILNCSFVWGFRITRKIENNRFLCGKVVVKGKMGKEIMHYYSSTYPLSGKYSSGRIYFVINNLETPCLNNLCPVFIEKFIILGHVL